MFSKTRRDFLRQASTAGMAGYASLALDGSIFAQSQSSNHAVNGPVRVYVDSRRTIGMLDPNLFGSFLEQLGRAIYEGIYDPGSKLSDSNGFRKDVMDEIRQLAVPIIRYPGGNFVSGYNWLDGVGPKQDRPHILDRAWNTVNSNQFGTNEFMAWCKAVGTKPLMAVNLGTGTPEQAAALVEYCNVEQGTKWSDLRRQHGYQEPYAVRHWCLGNEMDGPWQIGHMSATEYGSKAGDAARQMRDIEVSLKLTVCGSSAPSVPTYMEWDRQVLEECYDDIDGLSLHRYFGNGPEDTGGDSSKFLALNLQMEQQIAETIAVCDFVKAHKRSHKRLWLSFDEWNVWYRAGMGPASKGPLPQASHLLEEVYNLEDALLVGGMLNSLMRNADRVKIGCLAQLINVIAPILTNPNGVLKQTIYYPYCWAIQYAKGFVLDLLVESPTYPMAGMDRVPYVDVAGTVDAQNGTNSLFILNRDLVKAQAVEINWEKAPGGVIASSTLTGNDLKAVNSFDEPQRIAPQAVGKTSISGNHSTIEVPARSYTVIQWSA